MADSTSEQVRLILAAAERGAAEMRATAGTEASEHVARVQAAADGMLGKLDALESELTRLLSALRTSGERLVEGLAELQSEATLGHPRAATPPPAPAGDATDPRGADVPDAATPPTEASSADLPTAATPPAVPPSADLPGAATTPPVPAHADGDATEQSRSRAKPGSGDRLDAAPEHAPSPDAESPDSPSPDAERLDPATPAADSPASPQPGTESAAHESPPLSAPGAPDWPAPAEALFDAPPAGESLFAAAEPDEAGARLIALNMALGGSPRDDTRIFLEEHFALPDIEALLDDVYARAGR
jgi:hypothetical protein